MSVRTSVLSSKFFSGTTSGVLMTVFILTLVTQVRAGTRDTVSPNEFWFSSEVYYVEADATNAVINVEFAPGSRSWQGSVDFYTTDGTAVAGEDYTAASGTLNFSGPGTPVPQIIIPIHREAGREGNETVQISLSNPNAIITRSNATLIILKKPPTLQIASGANGTMVLTWPETDADFILEKTSQLSDVNWSEVTTPRNFSNGDCKVSEPAGTNLVFYRLRKVTQP